MTQKGLRVKEKLEKLGSLKIQTSVNLKVEVLAFSAFLSLIRIAYDIEKQYHFKG